MRKINSVSGQIDCNDLGYTLMHEHVLCADWSMRMIFKDKFFNKEKALETAVYLFNKVKQYGVNTIVDGTPINLGRDIDFIKEVSLRTGLNFIVSTGFYYQKEPWLVYRNQSEIYDWLIDECMNGIGDSGIQPGIMKCAIDEEEITPFQTKMLSVSGKVANKADIPLYLHTNPQLHSIDQALDILCESGISMNKVIVGHCSDTSDIDYLESLLKKGVYIGIDRFMKVDLNIKGYKENGIYLITELIRRGYIRQLLLSHDNAASLNFGLHSEATYENKETQHTFTYLHEVILPELLKEGITSKQIDILLKENPGCIFE